MTIYRVTVTVENPEDKERETLTYDCSFTYDEEQYGNGTYLNFGKDRTYDIRYDKDYSSDKPMQYLCDLCWWMWNGKNGAWVLKKFSIEEINE